jgi:hypothetical protein
MRRKNNTKARRSARIIKFQLRGIPRDERLPHGDTTKSPTCEVFNLAAPCCLPCQRVKVGSTVYDQHGGVWTVQAVRRRRRHTMLMLVGLRKPLWLSACHQFSPRRPKVRTIINRIRTFTLPIRHLDEPRKSKIVTLRDDTTDFARGDFVGYRLRGGKVRHYGWLVALGGKIAINNDVYEPESFDDIEEYARGEIVLTARALRHGEGVREVHDEWEGFDLITEGGAR